MPTITIDDVEYEVYGDVDQADEYFAAASHADAWRALEGDVEKQRALITATRTLDRQKWVGEKTDAEQPLAWPRTNTGIDGVEDDEVPPDIVNASFEIALLIVQGEDVQQNALTANMTKRLKAGSAEIEYFRGADADATRFPTIIDELIGKYLSGGSYAASGGFVSGVCGKTAFRNPCFRDPLLGD